MTVAGFKRRFARRRDADALQLGESECGGIATSGLRGGNDGLGAGEKAVDGATGRDPAVGDTGYAAQHRFAGAAEVDRDAVGLHRLGVHRPVDDLVVAALVINVVAAPEQPHDLDVLEQTAEALVHRHADAGVLRRRAAERHAQGETAAREAIEGRGVAGEQDGVEVGREHDGHAETDTRRDRRNPGQHLQRRQDVAAIEDVVAGPDRGEA